jgi:hypothetical protein
MHFKGLATCAVFRSSGFQIYFLGSSKLVAVKPPAPECGRYLKKQLLLPAGITIVVLLRRFSKMEVPV